MSIAKHGGTQLMLSLVALLLLGSMLVSKRAAAQTALIDTPVFQLNDDGGLVSKSIGLSMIPVEGSGIRLMWHPGLAAFRVGSVGGTQWDEVNVGRHSVAMGENTTADAYASTALGSHTMASGKFSTAVGFNTFALAYASLVLGQYNVIAGIPNNWATSNPVLVVGNGSGGGANRSNALTLQANGNLTIAGTLTENSDRRLKTDVRPLSDALDGLARLQPVRYRFREGTNRPEGAHIGLIAQEVQAVFPELVQQGADGYLSVSYTNLVAVLVQALNEQQTEIEEQQAGFDAQQAENEAQQTEIDALHDRLVRLEMLLVGAGAQTDADRK